MREQQAEEAAQSLSGFTDLQVKSLCDRETPPSQKIYLDRSSGFPPRVTNSVLTLLEPKFGIPHLSYPISLYNLRPLSNIESETSNVKRLSGLGTTEPIFPSSSTTTLSIHSSHPSPPQSHHFSSTSPRSFSGKRLHLAALTPHNCHCRFHFVLRRNHYHLRQSKLRPRCCHLHLHPRHPNPQTSKWWTNN